jgi:Putative 2OG-Fe(II) oxygenase
MKEQYYANFPNVGWVGATLTPIELSKTIGEMNSIQTNFMSAEEIHLGHAGNLKQEYRLKDCLPELEASILPLCAEYNQGFRYKPRNQKYRLKEGWINFQKKHEFFQPHTHNGIFSFALWLKVPYLIQDEIKFCSKRNHRIDTTATFNFIYTDALGRITPHTIPVDKTYENKIIVFPGDMTHSVNPFYTSDEYRIVVSGNIIEA